jgi:hypothetical protein
MPSSRASKVASFPTSPNNIFVHTVSGASEG